MSTHTIELGAAEAEAAPPPVAASVNPNIGKRIGQRTEIPVEAPA